MLKIILCLLLLNSLTDAQDIGRETLSPNDGWGSATTGTTGGSTATSNNVFTVTNRQQLVSALGSSTNQTPKIIYIQGTIDLSVDDNNNPMGHDDYADPAYDFDEYLATYDPDVWGWDDEPSGPLEDARVRSNTNQKNQVDIDIPPNTSIVGVGTNARVVGGTFSILAGVDNVIIRNIEFQDSYDYFPAWDPTDGSSGNWNSAFDAITVKGGTHIWIDHCTFNDGSRLDSSFPNYYGRKYQHHDGILDITNEANYLTVSYNYFYNHDKVGLLGSSDNAPGDDGKLKVTYHHNYYKDTMQRMPRVRYSQTHIYNNYYEGSDSTSANYRFSYAWGIGVNSKIYAENNVVDVPGITTSEIVDLYSGTTFYDEGTLLNGGSVNIASSIGINTNVGWTPSLHLAIDPSNNVEAIVRAQAGAGKL